MEQTEQSTGPILLGTSSGEEEGEIGRGRWGGERLGGGQVGRGTGGTGEDRMKHVSPIDWLSPFSDHAGSIFETDIDFQDSLLSKKKAYFTEVPITLPSTCSSSCFHFYSSSSPPLPLPLILSLLLLLILSLLLLLLLLRQVYQLLYDLAEHSEPVTGLWLEPFPNRPSPNEVCFP